jgi:hypothetical protein
MEALPTVPIPVFNRRPIHVFLLDVATFRFYTIYYLVFNYHAAQVRLGRPPTPGRRVIWLLPYSYFVGFSTIGKRVQVRVPMWLLYVASSALLASMHRKVARAEAADFPTLSRPTLTRAEIVVIVVGLSLFVYVFAIVPLLLLHGAQAN